MTLAELSAPVGAIRQPTSQVLSNADLYELRQCERIIHFRDSVFSGSHPNIKVPSHLVGKSSAVPPPSKSNQTANVQSFIANKEQPAHTGLCLPESRIFEQAQLHLQRMNLERRLAEQVEKNRTPGMILAQPEELVELNISDVLANAQALIAATAATTAASAGRGKDDAATLAASDSGNESSFYSSHHDSSFEISVVPPIRQQSLGNPKASAHDEVMSNGTSQVPEAFGRHTLNSLGASGVVNDDTRPGPAQDIPEPPPLASRSLPASAHKQSPIRKNYVTPRVPLTRPPFHSRRATGNSTPRSERQAVDTAAATPKQVSGPRPNMERKRGKRKLKRKADVQPPDAEPSILIKTEPHSPTPLNAVPYLRSTKRRKLSDKGGANNNAFAEPRNPPPGPSYQERYQGYGDDRPPVPMSRADDVVIRRSPGPTGAESRFHTRTYTDNRQYPTGSQPSRQPQSPTTYLQQQPAPGGVPFIGAPATSMPTSMPLESPYHEQRRPAYDQYEPNHIGIRPPGAIRSPLLVRERQSPMLGLQRPIATTRFVVDAYGREYVEHLAPNPSVVAREPAMSVIRPGETEVLYESSHAGPVLRQSYDAGTAYQPAAPAFQGPHRVFIHTDAGISDHSRAYGPREYSARPLGVSVDDYGEYPRFSERRPHDTQPYAARSASVHPVEPSVQYDTRRDYERIQLQPPPVHQLWVRDQGPHGHVQSRQTSMHPGAREYSVHPAEPRIPNREYSVRLVDPYPGDMQLHHHADDVHLERKDRAQTRPYGSRGLNRDGYA